MTGADLARRTTNASADVPAQPGASDHE